MLVWGGVLAYTGYTSQHCRSHYTAQLPSYGLVGFALLYSVISVISEVALMEQQIQNVIPDISLLDEGGLSV